MAKNYTEADRKRDIKEILSLEKELTSLGEKHFKTISKTLGVQEDLAEIASKQTKDGKFRKNVSQQTLQSLKAQLGSSKEIRDAVMKTYPGMFQMAAGAKSTLDNLKLVAKSGVGLVGIAIGIAKTFVKVAKAVTDTRKDLGVSVTEAAALTVANKGLAQAAKGFGLTLEEDILPAQAAIRKELGASVREAFDLSLNFARTAAATGQTSDQLARTLSVMESVSSASRDVLLNQLRTNATLAGQAGVTPALVMRDLADNALFFAKFAKDGGMNILNASIAARKLGLELGAVESISESLLNFESSIENQLQASLLLGRQINLDKARQLAITGDQEGVMREILKQVGGEAEFNRLNVIQRQALADSVGVNVEQLSRLVRNNTAAAGTGGTDKSVGLLQRIADNSDSLPSLNRKI